MRIGDLLVVKTFDNLPTSKIHKILFYMNSQVAKQSLFSAIREAELALEKIPIENIKMNNDIPEYLTVAHALLIDNYSLLAPPTAWTNDPYEYQKYYTWWLYR